MYDNRSSTPPAWLTSGFQRVTQGGYGLTSTAQACSLAGSDLCADAWDIYFADRFASERVCLGGNYAPGVEKMYIPVVGPLLYHGCIATAEERSIRQLIGLRVPAIAATPGSFVHNTSLSFLVREAFDAPIEPVNVLIKIAAADNAASPSSAVNLAC